MTKLKLDLFKSKPIHIQNVHHFNSISKTVEKSQENTPQRLRTDLGRSVKVATATLLTSVVKPVKGIPIPHLPQLLCNRGHKHSTITF